MAKSKYTEKHTVSVEGILNLEDMTIEIEDIGVKKIKDVFECLDGCLMKLNGTSSNELD